MNESASVPGSGTTEEVKETTSQQLAQYLSQQPESRLMLHRLMRVLEVISLGLIAVTFIFALYVSIRWTTVTPLTIPVAWLIFAGSAALVIVLIGIHTILIRADPIGVLSKSHKLLVGSEAIWTGAGIVVSGLVIGAFWGLFAYSVGTVNLDLVEVLVNILAAVLGVVIGISILLSLLRQFRKSL